MLGSDFDATTRDGHDTARLGRAAVDDRVEARAMLAHVSAALFDTPIPRSVLGRYTLQRRLGEGAFGVVYLGHDPELDRRVALKILRPSIELSEMVRMRFFREARALGSVQAPEVAAVYDVGTAAAPPELTADDGGDEVLYIVMELVDGSNLAEWLDAEPRSWKDVVRVFLQAGRGLAAAHDEGIVHRDFKPSNVLISHDGAVKVADFGLAMVVDGADGVVEDTAPSAIGAHIDTRPTLTRTGATVGTPPFMAPEQHNGSRAGPAADQFAFCASLYLALTGQQPFDAPTPAGLLVEKMGGNLRPWPSERAVPRWVRVIVERGLCPSADDRFGSMRGLLSRLRTSPAARVRAASGWVLGPVALLGVGAAVYDRFEPGTVELEVASDTGAELSGIRVDVDGERVEGLALRMSPGRHVVEVVADDHDAEVQAVEVTPGGTMALSLELPRHRGAVDITASPGAARIYVDGVDHGSRVRDLQLPTGSHVFDVRLEGHFSKQFRWTVERGAERTAHVGLTPVRMWSHPAPDLVRHVRWIPDLDGDHRDEVLVDRAGTIRVLDPWRDRTVGEFSVGHGKEWDTVVADGDGDGRPELFSFAIEGADRRLSCWSLAAADLGHERWRVELPGADRVHGRMVVVDGAAVVVTDGDAVAAYATSTGAAIWRRPAPDAPTIVDLGTRVLVSSKTRMQSLRGDGTLAWETETEAPAASVADVDSDGVRDVAVHEREGWAVRSAEEGAVLGRVSDPSVSSLEPVVIGGELRALLGRTSEGAVLFDAAGGTLRRIRAKWVKPIALDTRAFVAIARDDGTVVEAFDGEGPTLTLDGLEPRRISVGDFNGDGVSEWVARQHDGVLRFFDASLQPLATLELERSVNAVRALVDANHDGAADLLMQNNAGVLLVEGPPRQWTVRSQAGVRESPSIVDVDGERYVLSAVEREGHRTLSRIRGRDAKVFLGTEDVPQDLHREAAVAHTAGALHAYVGAGHGVRRHAVLDGRELSAQRLRAQTYATPTVLDVDGDGESEVLIGTFGGKQRPRLVVLDPTLERIEREVPMSNFTWGRALPADLDGDGTREVVVFGLEGVIEAFDPARDWTRLWSADVQTRINFAGALGGQPDDPVLAATTNGAAGIDDGLALVRASDGAVLEHHIGWGSGASAPVGFDADGDGTHELYAAGAHGRLRKFDGDWSTPAWTRVVSSVEGRATAPLIAGRLSEGGPAVVVVATKGGDIGLVDATSGELVWRSSVNARVEGHPQLADLDGDGRAELVVATHAGELISFRLRAASWLQLSG